MSLQVSRSEKICSTTSRSNGPTVFTRQDVERHVLEQYGRGWSLGILHASGLDLGARTTSQLLMRFTSLDTTLSLTSLPPGDFRLDLPPAVPHVPTAPLATSTTRVAVDLFVAWQAGNNTESAEKTEKIGWDGAPVDLNDLLYTGHSFDLL